MFHVMGAFQSKDYSRRRGFYGGPLPPRQVYNYTKYKPSREYGTGYIPPPEPPRYKAALERARNNRYELIAQLEIARLQKKYGR